MHEDFRQLARNNRRLRRAVMVGITVGLVIKVTILGVLAIGAYRVVETYFPELLNS